MQTLTHIQRHLQILIAFNSRQQGLTVVEIATEVGVATRTIRRDLQAIHAAGFSLKGRISRQNLKHWTLGNGGSVVPLSFNWSEAVVLSLGRGSSTSSAGAVLSAAAERFPTDPAHGLEQPQASSMRSIILIKLRTFFTFPGSYGLRKFTMHLPETTITASNPSRPPCAKSGRCECICPTGSMASCHLFDQLGLDDLVAEAARNPWRRTSEKPTES